MLDIINQSANVSAIVDTMNTLQCQAIFSTKEALAVQVFLFTILGVIILYELIGKAIPYFNEKFYTHLDSFEPSANKILFALIAFFLMQYYANYGVIHIVFLSVGLFVVFGSDCSKIIDDVIFKVLHIKTKSMIKREFEASK
jgi:hypothetical protein